MFIRTSTEGGLTYVNLDHVLEVRFHRPADARATERIVVSMAHTTADGEELSYTITDPAEIAACERLFELAPDDSRPEGGEPRGYIVGTPWPVT